MIMPPMMPHTPAYLPYFAADDTFLAPARYIAMAIDDVAAALFRRHAFFH